jgi:thiol-disulfide isomerase/thioredoxin
MKVTKTKAVGMILTSLILIGCVAPDSDLNEDAVAEPDIKFVYGRIDSLSKTDDVLVMASALEMNKEIEGLEGFSLVKLDGGEPKYLYIVEDANKKAPKISKQLSFKIFAIETRTVYQVSFGDALPQVLPKGESKPKEESEPKEESTTGFKLQGPLAGLSVNNTSYDTLTEGKQKMIVIFSATWCAPCEGLKRELDRNLKADGLDKKCVIKIIKPAENDYGPSDRVSFANNANWQSIAGSFPTVYAADNKSSVKIAGSYSAIRSQCQ